MSFVKNKNSNTAAYIFLLLFVSTEFLGSNYVGIISVRNFAVCAMFLYILLPLKKITFPKINEKELKLLGGYYLWVLFIGLFNGLYDNIGLTIAMGRFLPSMLIPIFFLKYVKSKNAFHKILITLIIILCINCFVSILQGINHPLGWKIPMLFQNKNAMDNTLSFMDENYENSIGKSVVSGLFSTPVINGYFIAAFGILFPIPIILKRNIKSVILSFIIFLLSIVALFFIQQRSAFYIYALLSTIILIILFFKQRNYILMLITLIMIIVVVMLSNNISIEWGRLADISDAGRDELRYNFHVFFSDNLILGNRSKFIELYGLTPHNLIAETFLLGGIIGLLIYLCFIIVLAIDLIKSLKSSDILITLTMLSTIIIIGISLTHSIGYHTGLTLGMYAFTFNTLSKKFAN